MKKGVPVSPGVAVARALCIDPGPLLREVQHLDDGAVAGELSRFDQACNAAGQELDGIISRVSQQLGEDEAAIFRAHRLLMRDPGLTGRVKSAIVERQIDAASALHQTLDEYGNLFSKIVDVYLQERMADLRDVIGRILANLAVQAPQESLEAEEPVILVAHEILPSQALGFDRKRLAGILTETGGTTGHAAILARSMGIPAVSGVRGLMREVRTGDTIALDGREGHVYLKPGPEVVTAYKKLQREYVDLCGQLIENHDQPAVTADGEPLELLANVNGLADVPSATCSGAVGVGLYRTEYLFLTHASVPDEEEQLATYRAIVEAAPKNKVTIRTLDLGGDKQVPYFGHHAEANPFMGWRSIRLTADYPEFFQTQLRAILRAGKFGTVSLLFPMVSTLEEVHRLKDMVDKARRQLVGTGVPFDDRMPFGIMIEVPAAALCIDALLDEVDFVSIGSNDLIQYLMAADRDNPKVAHLCEPFHPALLRLLNQIIGACNARGKPVTLCGEMAGLPRCFLALLGMGLRRLSMSPAFVPSIKELGRRTTIDAATEIVERVLKMNTVAEVRGYLTREVRQIWPNVTLLDTGN